MQLAFVPATASPSTLHAYASVPPAGCTAVTDSFFDAAVPRFTNPCAGVVFVSAGRIAGFSATSSTSARLAVDPSASSTTAVNG